MKRRVLIDLTALLDVILILLFMVLVNASGRAERVQRDADALAGQLAESQAENDALQTRVEQLDQLAFSEGLIDRECRVVTLSVTRQGDGTRLLRLLGEDFDRRYTLTWDNADTIRDAAAAELLPLCPTDPAGEYAVLFLAFRFDRAEIYQRDYLFVTGLLSQVKSGHDNVYTLEYDSKEDDYERS